jgi:hypothetical protein
MFRNGSEPDLWTRILRMAGRAIVCLGLALLPVATAGASHHHEAAIGAAHAPDGHAEAPASDDQDERAPICHHLGTCHAYVAPPIASFAHARPALAVTLTAVTAPPKAAAHRLFRPPRSAVSA